MSAIGCQEFLSRLDDWMEGKRPADTQAHWRECSRCRSVAGDFEAIREAARATAVFDAEPSPHVWPALRAQLEQEGLIHDRRERRAAGWRERLGAAFGIHPRPVLAGAYLTALVAVGVALVLPTGRQSSENPWMAHTRTATEPLQAHLASAAHDTISSLQSSDPVVAASLHQNLAIVDNYIALCEKSVSEEPDNEVARDYLYDAYHQKAALVAQMMERGEYGP